MNDRIKNSLSTEFKIFGDKSVRAIDGYAPSSSIRNEVAQIFIRAAKENGKRTSAGYLMLRASSNAELSVTPI